MRLLLDTHALLWWLSDDGRLGSRARDLIADPGNDVLVSAVSLWEIVIKVRIGKLAARIEDVVQALEHEGFTLLGLRPSHLVTLSGLPLHADHRDPFDHLLLAQAVSEGAAFVSEDRNSARYGARVVTCSDGSASSPPSAGTTHSP